MSVERVRFLDGLRGVLAVIVFIHHFIYAFCPDILFGGPYEEYIKKGWHLKKLIAATPLNFIFNPGFAIHFFFILSGYVQSFQYFKKPDLSILQKNLLKRYFRLAIPTMVVVMMVYFAHRLHLISTKYIPLDPITADWCKSMMPDNLSFFAALKHGLLDCYILKSKYYQVLWTMPTELLNSYMVFMLLFVTHSVKKRTSFLLLWILIQLFFLEAYFSVAFSAGMLICYLEHSNTNFRNAFSNPLLKWGCFIVGLYFATFPYTGYEKSTEHNMYKMLGFFERKTTIISYLVGDVLLLLFLLRSSFYIKLLSKKFFLFLGNISYMLYLVHLLLIFTFSPRIYHVIEFSMSKNSALIITFVLTALAVVGVSQLLYKYVDLPGLKACNKAVHRFIGL